MENSWTKYPDSPRASFTSEHEEFLKVSPCFDETYICRPGPFSHWNVRDHPSTDAPIVGMYREGDIIEVKSELKGWLDVKEGGWVRERNGDGRWEKIVMEVRNEWRTLTGCREICYVEENTDITVSIKIVEGKPFIYVADVARLLEHVAYDGYRTFTFNDVMSIIVKWDTLPTAISALRALTKTLPVWSRATQCPANASNSILPLQNFNVAVIPGILFKLPSGGDFTLLKAPAQSSEGFDKDLRRRLLNFFQFYRPGKLPSVMPTVYSSFGKEDLIMGTLVQKYGPEPRDIQSDPLRPGWRQTETPRGDIFYTHTSGKKQWVRPSEYSNDSAVSIPQGVVLPVG